MSYHRILLSAAVLVLFQPVNVAFGQHADVVINVVSDQLATNERLFLSDFRGGLANDGDILELRNPGYITRGTNVLEPNAPLYFDVVGPLLFSDGSTWQPAESTAYFEFFRPLIENHSVTVTGESNSQNGFVLAQADGQGVVHEHIRFLLGSEAEGPPQTGAYAVQQVLTSPERSDSDSFLLLFNNGLDTPDFIQSVVAARQVIADSQFDCSGDGLLLADDLACVTNIDQRDNVLRAISSIAGDLDGNGRIEFSDFLTLARNFGREGVGYAAGDIDLVGGVSFPDFLTLARNFGFDGQHQVANVPEPKATLGFTIAFVLFAVSYRRFFRK